MAKPNEIFNEIFTKISARLVGATVVGAARRLEAIRAAEPFAVVIEEACEVMEPTIMSVLAVKSLKKLELIGDHRQLPAFIQQCWFNLECSLPSIKISLFERLVTGSTKSRDRHRQDSVMPICHTILDEQRRMTPLISDITKPEYKDLVEILDHEHTRIQAIGDAVVGTCPDKKQVKSLETHRMLWHSQGRTVPGLEKDLYFWNLAGNKESRPVAGLSACNQTEAEACAALCKYLLLVGVPPASISIITPYKGQKTLITNILRKQNCIQPFRRDQPPARGTTITVSTVDRYQGDENDIVILSLVRANPGNRFVGLINRFIVAVSRARIGFYIVGSVKAVIEGANGAPGPQHWRRFVMNLELDEDLNTDDSMCRTVCDDPSDIVSRVGNELPIRCPRHGNVSVGSGRRRVRDPSGFPTESSWPVFCSQPCSYLLPRCGHACGVPCHNPVTSVHNMECIVPLLRPCELHEDVPLLCMEVSIKSQTLQEALASHPCEVLEVYHREDCEHSVNIECHVKSSIALGNSHLPTCKETVGDFVHPICNHLIKSPTCVERRKFEINPPNCQQTVTHVRQCGCKPKMKCFESVKEMSCPALCQSAVECPRPRCGKSHFYMINTV